MVEFNSELREVQFQEGAEAWPTDTGDGGRDDEYITAQYDARDGTFSLTYHPALQAVTIPCFARDHAVIALRDAGFSSPQISKILDEARLEARRVV